VQWDLLSSRPTLEPMLDRLGYRIRSGQWVVVDRADSSVRPGATLPDVGGDPGGPALPLAAIIGWFGPGSLAVPNTHAEWAWTLAMFGCASADLGDIDRQGLLEFVVGLAGTCRLESLYNAGPSALLTVLSDISSRRNHE